MLMLRSHNFTKWCALLRSLGMITKKGEFGMYPFFQASRMRLCLGAAIAAVCGIAVAQQAPAPAPVPETQLTEVIVTGSRIAAPNEVSTSPILSVSAQSMEVTGKTDISDLIQQLPQV